jgi:hypothetical protein
VFSSTGQAAESKHQLGNRHCCRAINQSKFAQGGFECGRHRTDVFGPKRVIAVEKWSN